MADVCDMANDQVEQCLQLSLRARAPELRFTGRCHNCEEKVPRGHFCDVECRADWEKRERSRKFELSAR